MTTTSTITAGIAALQVLKYGSATEYITIQDISATELHIESRDCPIFFPVPAEWKGGAEGSPDSETTFGTAAGRMWWKHQKFVYALAEDVAGAGRDINDQYLSASENADALWLALLGLDLDHVDVEGVNMTPIGTLTDPSGDDFIGCKFEITIREWIRP